MIIYLLHILIHIVLFHLFNIFVRWSSKQSLLILNLIMNRIYFKSRVSSVDAKLWIIFQSFTNLVLKGKQCLFDSSIILLFLIQYLIDYGRKILLYTNRKELYRFEMQPLSLDSGQAHSLITVFSLLWSQAFELGVMCLGQVVSFLYPGEFVIASYCLSSAVDVFCIGGTTCCKHTHVIHIKLIHADLLALSLVLDLLTVFYDLLPTHFRKHELEGLTAFESCFGSLI